MSNSLYNKLKWVALVGLPATTALWLTISQIWGIPYAEPIGATLAAVTTFLGAVLGISSLNYQKMLEKEVK